MSEDGLLPGVVGLMMKEVKRRLLALTVIFSVVALVTLGIGLVMPKRWDATTVILVDNDLVIKPILEGRAAVTPVGTQTTLVSQVVLGNKVLRQLALDTGILPEKAPPQEQEKIVGEFRKRIKIESKPTESLVRISYHDADPKRAAHITNVLGKAYINESATLRENESREAFNFIDNRVKEYGQKLTEAHKKLLDYYRGESTRSVTPGRAIAAVGPARDAPPGARLTSEELASLRVEAQTLESQLGRRSSASLAQDTKNLEDARNRVAKAQSDLDRLLVTYTDEHPDVRRAKRDLEVAKGELQRVEKARVDLEKARAETAALDDQVAQAARARLAEVQQKIAAATGRRPRSIALLARAAPEDAEKDPEMKGVGQDTKQSELFRMYDSTREIYQDLLKRRENARVSMDLDSEHRNFNMRVQEEAEVPATASSLRLMHFAIIGIVLALLIPIGVVFAIVKLDRRVRSPQQVENLARVPLLVAIPFEARRFRSLVRSRNLKVALLVAGVFVVYGTTFVIKMMST